MIFIYGGGGGGGVPRRIFPDKLIFAPIINTILDFHDNYIYVLRFTASTNYCLMLAVQRNTYSHYAYIHT